MTIVLISIAVVLLIAAVAAWSGAEVGREIDEEKGPDHPKPTEPEEPEYGEYPDD